MSFCGYAESLLIEFKGRLLIMSSFEIVTSPSVNGFKGLQSEISVHPAFSHSRNDIQLIVLLVVEIVCLFENFRFEYEGLIRETFNTIFKIYVFLRN